MKKIINCHISLGTIGLYLFLLNIYWLVFTLVGLIILGIVPTTKSLYQIIIEDSQTKKYESKNLFNRFFKIYKESFLTSNKIVFPALILLIVELFEIFFLRKITCSVFDNGVYIFLNVLVFATVMTIIYIFFFLNVDSLNHSLLTIYKNCFVLVLGKPFFSLGSIGILIIGAALYYIMPGLMMVFGLPLIIFFEVRYIFTKMDGSFFKLPEKSSAI